jgi:RNase P subunit RPR2
MLGSFLNALFGCSHHRTTFPLTPGHKLASSNNRHGTYVVCLDCGQEFRYDWKQMRIGEPVETRNAAGTETFSPAHSAR